MIGVDQGGHLHEIFRRAGARGQRGARLEIAVPFFDLECRFWKAIPEIAKTGTKVRLMTRMPEENSKESSLQLLKKLGVALVIVPNLHAKVVIWLGSEQTDRVGFVGSHNLTLSSENWAHELGIVFTGDGPVETLLLRETLAKLQGWEQEARRFSPMGKRERMRGKCNDVKTSK